MSIFTARFAIAAAERAVKTMAQTAAALIGTGAVGILDVDWAQIASVSALAAIVSLLTSVASAGIGPHGPSLADESIIEPLRITTGPDVHTASNAGDPIDPDEALR